MKINDFLTTKSAARVLGVNEYILRFWALQKKVKSYSHPVTGHNLFLEKDLQKILNDLVKQVKE